MNESSVMCAVLLLSTTFSSAHEHSREHWNSRLYDVMNMKWNINKRRVGNQQSNENEDADHQRSLPRLHHVQSSKQEKLHVEMLKRLIPGRLLVSYGCDLSIWKVSGSE